MKPFDSNDPILRSLAEDAADLPLKAAGEARRTHARRMKQRRHLALAVTVLLCGLCVWQFNGVREAPLKIATQTTKPPSPYGSHVIMRTEEQARQNPLPLSEGLSAEQANVVQAASGLPLLLVRDHTGKVTRIHAIER